LRDVTDTLVVLRAAWLAALAPLEIRSEVPGCLIGCGTGCRAESADADEVLDLPYHVLRRVACH
jgi:hypothetical protein